MVNITNKPAAGTSEKPGPESELKTCVREQSIVFENAVRLIERLEDAANQRTLGNPDSVSQLQKSLDQVVAAQQKVAAAHNRFSQTKATLTPDLKVILGQHESLLKTLIFRIDHLQKTFESARTELTPQLDVESRRRNMQAAYQQSLKTI